jgi:peptide/nickel transport system substrate-binding protein
VVVGSRLRRERHRRVSGHADEPEQGRVVVAGKYTVQLRLSAPSAIVKPYQTVLYAPFVDLTELRKHLTSDDRAGRNCLSTNGAGFGPYYLAQLTAGQQAVLKLNPNWNPKTFDVQKLPDIGTVIYQAIPEGANRLALIKRGDVDVALDLSADQLDSLKGDPNVTITSAKGNNILGVIMNTKVAPLDDTRVRQALSYAVPYTQILKDVFKGHADAIRSYVPPTSPGYTEKYFPYKEDLNKAKSLLRAAGVTSARK